MKLLNSELRVSDNNHICALDNIVHSSMYMILLQLQQRLGCTKRGFTSNQVLWLTEEYL